MTPEQTSQAIDAINRYLLTLSSSHIATSRFFLSRMPHLSAEETDLILRTLEGFEVHMRSLRDHIESLEDL